jgi:hypothetical protein
MNPQLDLDLRIDQEHAALERAEQDALRIIERLKAIPGTEGILRRKRLFGEIPNPWAGEPNVTAQAAVIRADRTLAAWLAAQAGKSIPAPDYAAQAEEEKWNASARRMEAKVAEMQAASAARRAANDQRRSRGWVNREGQWVI